MIFTPRIPPGTPPPPPTDDSQPAKCHHPLRDATKSKRQEPRSRRNPKRRPSPSHPQKKANGEKPPTVGRIGGSGGSSPRKSAASPRRGLVWAVIRAPP